MSYPELKNALIQMGLEGCKRALKECEENPEKVLTNGEIFDEEGRY